MAIGNRRFYLNKERGKITGVCAGISDYFGWDVTLVRIGWVIATIIWPIMILAYILLSWLVDPKPSDFMTSRYAAGIGPIVPPSFTDVKSRFDRLEDRLRSMERVVTSREFQMDRELRGAGRT